VRRGPVWNTVISSDPTGTARKSPKASGRQKAILAAIVVRVAARIAWDRRTHERVILVALVVAAAAGLAHASGSRSIARLIAWDKQQTLAEQSRAKTSRS
jgi:hypothetical protein